MAAGTGYDSDKVLSPDGRIFQVEYAMKAVENSSTVIGILCKDGVVLAAERQIMSKLHESDSYCHRRIYNIDSHIGCAVAGFLTDARHLVDIARSEAASYRENWDLPIPISELVKRISHYMFQYTLNGYYRTFGCSVIIGGCDPVSNKYELWMADPAGVSWRYKGISTGKTRQAAKTELEKIEPKVGELLVNQAIKEATKVIHAVRDESNASKTFVIDMSTVGGNNPSEHAFCSKQVKEDAEKWAKDALESDSDEDEDDDDVM